VLTLALVLLASNIASTQAAPAPRAYVDPAGACHAKAPCYRSIQAAIDKSAPGTAITAGRGTYHEHVVLDKALTLQGRNATIAGGGSGTILSLTGSGATVRTLTLTNSDIGVGLRGADANRIAGLHVTRVERGIFFSTRATGNLVENTEVADARRFAIDVGDQNDSGNRFLRLRLHDSATGFNAYRGSDGLVLKDSSIRKMAPGPAVVIGWSDGWRVEGNEIVRNSTGILTDTVRSGSIAHNYISRNANNGIDEAGLVSSVTTHDNRIERNGRSGIALCIAARNNDVQRNMVLDNARYGVEVCAHPSPAYFNTDNTVSGNYLFSGAGMLGDARDDQGSNLWSANYYSLNLPWSAPFAIPGTAAAQDASPLVQANLPVPANLAACRRNGWWLLSDGTIPFESLRACLRFAKTISVEDKDCSDFATQRAAQVFFLEHGGPQHDPHRLDGDHDGVACEDNPCPCYRETHLRPRTAGRFDNGEWVVAKSDGAGIPEEPFEVRVDGGSIGSTRLLTFANRVRATSRFPQVLAIASSGYLRIKSGADPTPPLPFGQSLVLGPAVFGTSTSFPSSTLFFNPQIQRVDVDTRKLHRHGTGNLLIQIQARDRGLPETSTNTNQIMALNWKVVLNEPTEARTRLRVNGGFRFTEPVVPDPVRTAEFQSFRLFQLSSMFIDGERHDVDAFRYRGRGRPVEVSYDPTLVNSLLPATPAPLAAGAPIESIHTDDAGQPNGNTPSYRIAIERAAGPISGPLTPRAFFNDSQDLNDDNLGLWIHRRPATVIPAGAHGTIAFSVVATADPLPTRHRAGPRALPMH